LSFTHNWHIELEPQTKTHYGIGTQAILIQAINLTDFHLQRLQTISPHHTIILQDLYNISSKDV